MVMAPSPRTKEAFAPRNKETTVLPTKVDLSDKITDPRLKDLYEKLKNQPNVLQFDGSLTVFVNGNLTFIGTKIHWNPEMDEMGFPIEKTIEKTKKSKCESCTRIRRVWNKLVRKLMLPV